MPGKDDFTAVKDSVVMGDVNQNFSIPNSESFDELLERLISCQDSKQRFEIFKQNEFKLLKGLTEIITLSNEYWSELKDHRFERFISEIFDSELRRTVLGSKLYKLSIDEDLKDMQYLWHLGGVFSGGNTIDSVKKLLDCIKSMNKVEQSDDWYNGFLNRWWWDGQDNYSVLKHIFSTLSDYNIKKLYELCKDYENFHFNEHIICYLYSSNSISKEYRAVLNNDLQSMLNEIINPFSHDSIIVKLWEEYSVGWVSILLTRAAIISERDLDIYERQTFDFEMEQIHKLMEEDDKFRIQKKAEPFFSDVKVYSYPYNILEIIQKVKDKCKEYPMIGDF